MKDGTYKNMKGGLFSGEPLEVVKDPSREIRAQQVAESLRSLASGSCAIYEPLMKAVYQKLGYEGDPPIEWVVKVSENVALLKGSLPAPGMEGYNDKQNNKDYRAGLTSLAYRLMKP